MVSVPPVHVGRRVGLGQVAVSADSDRRVIGAEDVDGHRGEGTVGAGDRKVSV